MNLRNPLIAIAFVALTTPLAALADAPSGEAYDTAIFPKPVADQTAAWDRSQAAYDVEHAFDKEMQIVRDSESAKTRDEVKRELAESPMPKVEA